MRVKDHTCFHTCLATDWSNFKPRCNNANSWWKGVVILITDKLLLSVDMFSFGLAGMQFEQNVKIQNLLPM